MVTFKSDNLLCAVHIYLFISPNQIVYMKVALPPISRAMYPAVESNGPQDYLIVADDASECSFLVDNSSLTKTLQTPVTPPPTELAAGIESQVIAEKVLVSILKSPSRRASYNGNVTNRKDDIRATFSEDIAVTCGEKRESSGSKKEKPARSFSFSVNEKVIVDEGEGDGEGEERLTVGLIDYAFLIGPLEDSFITTEVGVDGQRRDKKIHVQYSISPGSEGSRAPLTRFGSHLATDEPDLSSTPAPAPSAPPMLPNLRRGSSAPMDCDMCIWDRFPSEDHDESPLPAKVRLDDFL